VATYGNGLTRRRLLVGGATILGAALVAACSQSTPSSPTSTPAATAASAGSASPTPAAAPTKAAAAATATTAPAAQASPAAQGGKLEMFTGKILNPPGVQDTVNKQLIADFQKLHPGVEISWSTYTSAAQETTKIETSVAAGTGPDIFEFGSTVLPTAAATGDYVVLSDADWTALGGKSKFFPAQLKMSGLNPSQLIGVPEYMLPFALVYNEDLLSSAGVEKPPTTWTEFIDAAKKITNPSKSIWGTVMDPSDPFDPWHIIWVLTKQYGGDFVSADLKKATMDTPQVYDANRFWFDWMAKYKVADLGDATFKSSDQLNAFSSGHVGMLVMQGPTLIPSLDKSAVAGKYAFAPMPTIPYGMSALPTGGEPVQTFVSGQYLTIAKYTKVKELALEWLKFMTDVPQQMLFLKSYGYMPAITTAYKQPELQTPVWKAFVDAEDHAYATPLTGAWGPIEVVVGGYSAKIAASIATNSYQAGDLKKALTAAQDQVQKLLDAAQKKSG
jgi:multiple sugar transport system substrate-binding protein